MSASRGAARSARCAARVRRRRPRRRSARRVRADPGRGRAGPARDRRADRAYRRTPTASTARHHAGEPLRLAMLGDSSAGGLGVDAPAPDAGRAAGRRAGRVRRPPGAAAQRRGGRARSSDLAGQVELIADSRPDLAVIMIGANDVTHRVQAAGRGAPPRPRGAAGCTSSAPRSSSAPARTSAPSSRSRSRCAGSPGGPAASSPRPRPSRWSRPAAAPCRSATSSARSSRPRRGDVRAGPVPPVGGRLRQRRGRDAALGLRRAGRLDRRPRRSRRPT